MFNFAWARNFHRPDEDIGLPDADAKEEAAAQLQKRAIGGFRLLAIVSNPTLAAANSLPPPPKQRRRHSRQRSQVHQSSPFQQAYLRERMQHWMIYRPKRATRQFLKISTTYGSKARSSHPTYKWENPFTKHFPDLNSDCQLKCLYADHHVRIEIIAIVTCAKSFFKRNLLRQ